MQYIVDGVAIEIANTNKKEEETDVSKKNRMFSYLKGYAELRKKHDEK